ncbi:MAG: asparagine synthase-related protein [Anaerolineae bacterium]|nr:asparagine synthase-related protein [Anaerolineae bacterium]
MSVVLGHFNTAGADSELVARMADGLPTYRHGKLILSAAPEACHAEPSVQVALSGVLYNSLALWRALEASAAVRTEKPERAAALVAYGYLVWGVEVLERLHGAFALAIWDAQRQWLILARDRMGEKALYYASHGADFLFATQARRILAAECLPRAVNLSALPYYLSVGYVPPPHTLFEGVCKLGAAEYMLVNEHGYRIDRFWRPRMDTISNGRIAFEDAVQRLRHTLDEAVKVRVQDVPSVGALLGSGIDSAAVAALIAQHTGQVKTYTANFAPISGTSLHTDAYFAALSARKIGAQHHTVTVPSDERLAVFLPHVFAALDEPASQPSVVPLAYAVALAREHGTQRLLSGEGSDELFAGQRLYRSDRLLELYLQVPATLRRFLTPLLARLPAKFKRLAVRARETDAVRRYLAWMRLTALERLPYLLTDQALAKSAHSLLSQVLRPILSAPRTHHFADRIAFANLSLWLAECANVRLDQIGTAFGVPISAPFEDHHLVNFALHTPLCHKLRGNGYKIVLQHAVADLVPSVLLNRPKRDPFAAAAVWLRSALKPLMARYLSSARLAEANIFVPQAVADLIAAHQSGVVNEARTLWLILAFQLWHARHITGDLQLEDDFDPLERVELSAWHA